MAAARQPTLYMNNIFDKFSVYEQIAYFLVGGFACFLFYLDFEFIGYETPIIFNEVIFIISVSYFLGHLTQAICNLVFKENKEDFENEEIVILDEIKAKYLNKDSSHKRAFEILLLHSLHIDKVGQINTFNANYGLYRGWSLILLVEAIFFVIQLIWIYIANHIFDVVSFTGLIISLILSYVIFKRSRRFFKYLRRKTFNIYRLNKNRN
jgi:hypothetical protein